MTSENWRKSSYSGGQGGACVEVGTWRKSSYSGAQGGQCVEVGTWRKSSYSGGSGGQCVEVASAPHLIAIRDTKDQGTGPVLRITAGAWKAFTDGLK